MSKLFEELKRRNVFKVAITYAVVAWLMAQVAEFSASTFGAPEWVLRTFVVFVILGLPIAVILAWAFDVTPEGVKKAAEITAGDTGKRGINFGGAILLGVVLVAAVVLQFWGPEISVQSNNSPTRHATGEQSQHFDIAFPESTPLAFIGAAALGNGRRAFAISPDGSRIVYLGIRDNEYALYVRELDSHAVRKLPGTENGYDPFFSPNGEWLAFFAGNELKRVRLDGGAAVTITEATNSAGGSWVSNSIIVAATHEGDNALRTTIQGDREESQNPSEFQAPQPLPGSTNMLISGRLENIRVGDLSTGESRSLDIIGSHAQYFAGFIFYSQGSNLFAARFDPVMQTLESTPVLILSDVRSEVYGFSQWSVSENGTFLYAPGIAANENPLRWVRGNKRVDLEIPRRFKGSFEISPDGAQLAVLEEQSGVTDLWLYDFKGTPPRKLTVDGNVHDNLLAWMPDGESIIYHVSDGDLTIAQQIFLESGMQGSRLLGDSEESIRVVSVSQDGRYLTISRRNELARKKDATGRYIDLLAVIDTLTDQEIGIPIQSNEAWGIAISPNGRAVVYTSPESGEYQNYLQPFPPTGQRFQISRVGGAEEPRWSRDGGKIYYRSGQRIMVVDVQTAPEIKLGEPQVFFEGEFVNVGGRSYDISPDGERALVISASEGTASSIRVITNWFDVVERVISANE